MPCIVHLNKRKITIPFPGPITAIILPYTSLVVLRRSLAGLELLEVPVADLHVTIVVIHALREVLGSALAVVRSVPVVRGLVVLRDGGGVRLRGGSGFRGAAAEPATDSVADGGTDCYTAVMC